jgi:serine/threonine protein kinase/Flp pilus assembly protein TadD
MASEQLSEASIFNTARKLDSLDARSRYLDDACGDDTQLRRRVEHLLEAFDAESQFLEKPALGLPETLGSQDANNLAAAMQAGLTSAFSIDQAVVIGDPNHSVLRSIANTLGDVPRVSLREPKNESPEPILRPMSPEIPKSDSTSRYRLDGEIARGGMGAILKGRDTDLGRDLAIKVLLDAHKDNPLVIQRFIEEAQIGGQLQHPGIAPVYELGQFADQRPFFSMKLVKGETLSKLLADRIDPSDERSKFVGIFEQVCQTMAYAHSRGVIHRDLKPANIMVGAFGEVQVMDWGLAKVLASGGVADEKHAKQKQQGQSIIQTMRSMGSDAPGTFGSHGSGGSDTQMGSVMGTPAYMPPEQALGEIDQLDRRADVFGLGAILAEILTGKPPYVGEDGTQVYRMASRGKLEDCFKRLTACGADQDLIALTKHCLELEPSERPSDAGVLAERVTEYQQSVETKLRETELQRATEAARVVEQKKRLRVTLALAAAVFMILLGGGSFAWWQNQQNQLVLRREARNAEAVASLIDQCIEALQSGDTAKAAVVLQAAQQRSEEGGAEQYVSRLNFLETDLQLLRDLEALESLSLNYLEGNTGSLDYSLQQEKNVLGRFGLDLESTSISFDKVTARMSNSVVGDRILGVLDELLMYERKASVLELLRQLDSDPFRDAMREAVIQADDSKITELSGQAAASQQPPRFISNVLANHNAIAIERRMRFLEEAAIRYPSDVNLLVALYLLSLQINDADESLRWAQAAVSANPNIPVSLEYLANSLDRKKDWESAIALRRKAISLSPNYAIAHMHLGSALSQIGDLEGAEAELRTAVELYPELFGTHFNLGAFLCDKKHDFEGAIECFRKAIKLQPDFSYSHSNLGNALGNNGDIDGAIEEYRKAIELGRNDAMVHLKLASRLIGDKGELDDGISHIRTAILLEPEHHFAHHFLGLALEMRDTDEAIASYRKAVELDPKNADYQQTLGIALFRKGQWQEASDALIVSIEQGNDKPQLWLYLAMANFNLDQKDNAMDWYKKSVEWRSANMDAFTSDDDLQSLFNEAATLLVPAPSDKRDASAAPQSSSSELSP